MPLLLLAAALAAPPPTVAVAPADTLTLSLQDAVARALSKGEEMRAARANRMQTEGIVREAFSQALPQVSASLTYDRRLDSIYKGAEGDTLLGALFANSPFAAANTWNVELTASQILFSSGKTSAGIRAARAAHRSSAASVRQAADDVKFDVTRAYLDAALSHRLVAIAEADLAQARDHLHDVRLQQEQGTRSEYELIRARVDAANQEPAVVAARNGEEIAMLELKRLVNLPFDQPVALSTPLAFHDDLVPVVNTDSLPPATRPSLEAAEANVEGRRQLLRVERGRRWPDLSVSTTLSHQAFPKDGLPTRSQFLRDWSAEAKLTLPIFTGFRTSGTIQEARAQFELARADRDRARETVSLEVEQARAEVDRALSLLHARRETVRQAARGYHLADVRFSNGLSTQLEVSDARVQLRTAEVNEVQATRDYLVALAQLERALGRPVPVRPTPLSELTTTVNVQGNE